MTASLAWSARLHRIPAVALVGLALLAASTAQADAPRDALADPVAAGDHAWSLRAERLDGDRADPTRIREAIEHYEAAVERNGEALGPRWRLLRALHYAIDFSALSDEEKDALSERAVDLARASAPRAEGDARAEATDADRARVQFWSAIAWGTRAQRVGLLTIVREGVARRMYDLAEASLRLDPSVDRGGALRLLSRLHGTLPRVPFVSGWVDRDEALALAERGHRLDSDHPGNRLILALTLLEQAPERHAEARGLLEQVATSEPRPDFLVEDRAIREQARERLAALDDDP